ncbi:hypothetical protein NPIL_639111 [Nephila pilipes]|uniref:Uncharacterized protein n=1 Tax=Nephila pilipes TaxID=299642 RepID=A0A8X6QHY9_NEPPI|nr:hypothetical protein NPIL_639111 [Nephila pilipes]
MSLVTVTFWNSLVMMGLTCRSIKFLRRVSTMGVSSPPSNGVRLRESNLISEMRVTLKLVTVHVDPGMNRCSTVITTLISKASRLTSKLTTCPTRRARLLPNCPTRPPSKSETMNYTEVANAVVRNDSFCKS